MSYIIVLVGGVLGDQDKLASAEFLTPLRSIDSPNRTLPHHIAPPGNPAANHMTRLEARWPIQVSH